MQIQADRYSASGKIAADSTAAGTGTEPGAGEGRRGLLIILSSPSGAGKSTLARAAAGWDPDIRFSVSATTRAPRDGRGGRARVSFRRPRAAFEADGRRRRHAGTCRGVRQSLRLAPRPGRGGAGAGPRHAVRHRLAGRPADPPLGPGAATWCRSSCCRRRWRNWNARLRRAAKDSARGDRPAAWRRAATRSATGTHTTTSWSTDDVDACEQALRAIVTAERLSATAAALAGRFRARAECGGNGMIWALEGHAPRTRRRPPGWRPMPTSSARCGCWPTPRSGSAPPCAATTR